MSGEGGGGLRDSHAYYIHVHVYTYMCMTEKNQVSQTRGICVYMYVHMCTQYMYIVIASVHVRVCYITIYHPGQTLCCTEQVRLQISSGFPHKQLLLVDLLDSVSCKIEGW